MKLKIRKKPFLIGTLVILLLLIAGGFIWYFSPSNLEYEDIGMRPSKDIADNILEAPGNIRFAKFIDQVGYDTFLHGEGPYTIFVPTDAAYANLPTDATLALLDADDEGFLRQVLLYHVVKGKFDFDDLREGLILITIQGEELHFSLVDGYWVINDYAYIEKADIESKNGIIHLMTNYLIPPSLLLDQ